MSTVPLLGCTTYAELVQLGPAGRKARKSITTIATKKLPEGVTVSRLSPSTKDAYLEQVFQQYAKSMMMRGGTHSLEVTQTTTMTVRSDPSSSTALVGYVHPPGNSTAMITTGCNREQGLICRPSSTAATQLMPYGMDLTTADKTLDERVEMLLSVLKPRVPWGGRTGAAELADCVRALIDAHRSSSRDTLGFVVSLVEYWYCELPPVELQRTVAQWRKEAAFNHRMIKLALPAAPMSPLVLPGHPEQYRLVEGGYRNHENQFLLVWCFRDDVKLVHERLLPLIRRCQGGTEEAWTRAVVDLVVERAVAQCNSANNAMIKELRLHCQANLWHDLDDHLNDIVGRWEELQEQRALAEMEHHDSQTMKLVDRRFDKMAEHPDLFYRWLKDRGIELTRQEQRVVEHGVVRVTPDTTDWDVFYGLPDPDQPGDYLLYKMYSAEDQTYRSKVAYHATGQAAAIERYVNGADQDDGQDEDDHNSWPGSDEEEDNMEDDNNDVPGSDEEEDNMEDDNNDVPASDHENDNPSSASTRLSVSKPTSTVASPASSSPASPSSEPSADEGCPTDRPMGDSVVSVSPSVEPVKKKRRGG